MNESYPTLDKPYRWSKGWEGGKYGGWIISGEPIENISGSNKISVQIYVDFFFFFLKVYMEFWFKKLKKIIFLKKCLIWKRSNSFVNEN